MKLYIHVQKDGGILILDEQLKVALVSKSRLKSKLLQAQRSGGTILYSREACESASGVFQDVFALIESFHLPIQMIDPIEDVCRRPNDYVPPLIHAAYHGDLEWLGELIAWKVDLEIRDRFGQTALMLAADAGQLQSVKMLLDSGASVDSTVPQDGSTALMFASQHGYTDVVRELLKHGASSRSFGSHGFDALGLAQRNGHSEVAMLLAH